MALPKLFRKPKKGAKKRTDSKKSDLKERWAKLNRRKEFRKLSTKQKLALLLAGIGTGVALMHGTPARAAEPVNNPRAVLTMPSGVSLKENASKNNVMKKNADTKNKGLVIKRYDYDRINSHIKEVEGKANSDFLKGHRKLVENLNKRSELRARLKKYIEDARKIHNAKIEDDIKFIRAMEDLFRNMFDDYKLGNHLNKIVEKMIEDDEYEEAMHKLLIKVQNEKNVDLERVFKTLTTQKQKEAYKDIKKLLSVIPEEYAIAFQENVREKHANDLKFAIENAKVDLSRALDEFTQNEIDQLNKGLNHLFDLVKENSVVSREDYIGAKNAFAERISEFNKKYGLSIPNLDSLLENSNAENDVESALKDNNKIKLRVKEKFMNQLKYELKSLPALRETFKQVEKYRSLGLIEIKNNMNKPKTIILKNGKYNKRIKELENLNKKIAENLEKVIGELKVVQKPWGEVKETFIRKYKDKEMYDVIKNNVKEEHLKQWLDLFNKLDPEVGKQLYFMIFEEGNKDLVNTFENLFNEVNKNVNWQDAILKDKNINEALMKVIDHETTVKKWKGRAKKAGEIVLGFVGLLSLLAWRGRRIRKKQAQQNQPQKKKTTP